MKNLSIEKDYLLKEAAKIQNAEKAIDDYPHSLVFDHNGDNLCLVADSHPCGHVFLLQPSGMMVETMFPEPYRRFACRWTMVSVNASLDMTENHGMQLHIWSVAPVKIGEDEDEKTDTQ